MNHWTFARKLSLVVHGTVVLIPLGFSTVSALFFWQRLFASWLLAVPMVAVIDVPALLGFALHIARIESPFVALRHALPVISIVPLGLELHALLAHNGPVVALSTAALVTIILVVIAWQCYATIERLFIDPVTAAREWSHQQLRALAVAQAQLLETRAVAESFVSEWMHGNVAINAPMIAEQVPAFPVPAQASIETTKATFACPTCGAQLSLGAYGAAKRHGHCKACKETS